MKEMTPLRLSGMNCMHLSINSILNYKSIPNPRTVWKQCGMVYTKSNGQLFGELNGSYKSVEDELEWVHNLKVINSVNKDSTTFLKEIKFMIESGEPVIVFVDCYHLENNIFFQERHIMHTIVLVDYSENSFTYVDNAYYSKGEINVGTLIKAAGSDYEQTKEPVFYFLYVQVNEFNSARKDDYIDVIAQNTKEIKGFNSSEIKLDRGLMEIKGYKGLQSIVKDFNLIIDIDLEINQYYDIYSTIADTSNNHYLFANFLEEGIIYFPQIQRISSALIPVAQDLKVISNMVLKGITGNRELMINRIITKLENTYEKGMKLIEIMEEIIEQFEENNEPKIR